MKIKEIKTICPFCKTSNAINVAQDEYNNWINGEHIQDAFPNMQAAQREMLKTGICEKCWDEIFA